MITESFFNASSVAANGLLSLSSINGVNGIMPTTAGTVTVTVDGIAHNAITLTNGVFCKLQLGGRTISLQFAGGAAGIVTYK